MTTTRKIDFVSDVSCPRCIIGLKALEQAADRFKGEVALDLHFYCSVRRYAAHQTTPFGAWRRCKSSR